MASEKQVETLKELTDAFNQLDIRCYSRRDNKMGTIMAYSPKTGAYHYINRNRDDSTGEWSWVVGEACKTQPSQKKEFVEIDA